MSVTRKVETPEVRISYCITVDRDFAVANLVHDLSEVPGNAKLVDIEQGPGYYTFYFLETRPVP